MKNALTYSKAIAAFVGSLTTALLGIYGPETKVGAALVVVAAVATVVATYRLPNAE
jgi:hypothetical protein